MRNDKESAQQDYTHDHDESHGHAGILGENAELAFSILSAALLATAYLLPSTALPENVRVLIYIGSYFFGGAFALKEALENLRRRHLEIDSLMLLAALGAAILGEWPEGALLLVLFSLGHALEHYALGKARKSIEALAKLSPETAWVKTNGQWLETPVEKVPVGAIVLVKPDERVPVDGFVTSGQSAVNEAPITGESIPVDKKPFAENGPTARSSADHRVFAGAINGSGTLEIEVTKISSESTLAHVIDMIRNAEAKKSPTQLLTDRIQRVFVPAILGLVLLLPLAHFILDEPLKESIYRALAVLVAASPCALAIATPSAVLSAVARAARGGVLVKGGAALEGLGSVRSIAFDKTGTLTEGRPRVTDLIAISKETESDFLSITLAVEKLSEHPLAKAIVSHLEGQTIFTIDRSLNVKDMQSLTGQGVEAEIAGRRILVGKKDLFSKASGWHGKIVEIASQLESQGRTLVIVQADTIFLGAIGLMDTPRTEARGVISALKSLGISQLTMLSGDNQRVADEVARELGLTKAYGNLMPEEKVRLVREMKAQGPVVMIGDGVNDAPAMTEASVAVAMGAAGSDVALQTADIALMSSNLTTLPFAIGLSRQSRSVIRQNLWISLGIVAVLVPSTLLGLKISFAVIVHEGSTLLVVFNALRLLAYSPRGLSK